MSSSKVYLDELEQGDITRFENYMRQAGSSDRTILYRVTFLRSFLNWTDRGVVMAKFELPRYTEKGVSAYEAHELHKMLSVGDAEDRSYLQFLVGAGFREGEAMHATYSDIDHDRRIIKVKDKPQYRFRIRDAEEREVPLPQSLLASLRTRQLANPGIQLIFPSANGSPDGHRLRFIKQLQLRAGLNCGNCVSDDGKQRCDVHPTCSRANQHKARKTFATQLSATQMSLQTIRQLLGHSSLETTQKYLVTADLQSERILAQVDLSFSRLDVEPLAA